MLKMISKSKMYEVVEQLAEQTADDTAVMGLAVGVV